VISVLPGDVLAVRGGSIAAAAIRLGAALLGRPNLSNHVAVVSHADGNGTLWVIEGRPGGVGWRDAADYLASPWTLTNAAQPKAPEQRALVTRTAKAMLGTPYDWAAIAGDALDDLHLWDPGGGVVRGHVVCSALAALAYDKAGLARPAGDERMVQPADWDSWMLTQAWPRG
jgi:hypothetical protein